jgi:hypothetical protein
MTSTTEALRLIESVIGRRYEELTEAELIAWENRHAMSRRNTDLNLWTWRPRAEDAR